MKPWYRATVNEAQGFFKMDLAAGLDEQEVLNRLQHFGKNHDSSLSSELAKIYKVTVIRQHQRQRISLEQLVLGDIVAIKAGDRVPADLRLFKVERLKIDESKLNGNHLPVLKHTYAATKKATSERQKNMAFKGTIVTEGQGLGIVVARGEDATYKYPAKYRTARLSIKTRFIIRRLRRLGISVLNPQQLKALAKINMVIFDTEYTDKEIADTIRRLQLVKKIPCKFLVSQTQADRLQAEFIQARITSADNMVKLTPMNLVDAVEDAQFITGANQSNMLKVIKTLQEAGHYVLWVSDGKYLMPAMQIADLSLVIGDSAQDIVICQTSLVAPQASLATVPSIFYNRK